MNFNKLCTLCICFVFIAFAGVKHNLKSTDNPRKPHPSPLLTTEMAFTVTTYYLFYITKEITYTDYYMLENNMAKVISNLSADDIYDLKEFYLSQMHVTRNELETSQTKHAQAKRALRDNKLEIVRPIIQRELHELSQDDINGITLEF